MIVKDIRSFQLPALLQQHVLVFSVNKSGDDVLFVTGVFPWQGGGMPQCWHSPGQCPWTAGIQPPVTPWSCGLSSTVSGPERMSLTWSPVMITSFILVYCSSCASRFSKFTILFSFSKFWIQSNFMSSATSKMFFCWSWIELVWLEVQRPFNSLTLLCRCCLSVGPLLQIQIWLFLINKLTNRIVYSLM